MDDAKNPNAYQMCYDAVKALQEAQFAFDNADDAQMSYATKRALHDARCAAEFARWFFPDELVQAIKDWAAEHPDYAGLMGKIKAGAPESNG